MSHKAHLCPKWPTSHHVFSLQRLRRQISAAFSFLSRTVEEIINRLNEDFLLRWRQFFDFYPAVAGSSSAVSSLIPPKASRLAATPPPMVPTWLPLRWRSGDLVGFLGRVLWISGCRSPSSAVVGYKLSGSFSPALLYFYFFCQAPPN